MNVLLVVGQGQGQYNQILVVWLVKQISLTSFDVDSHVLHTTDMTFDSKVKVRTLKFCLYDMY